MLAHDGEAAGDVLAAGFGVAVVGALLCDAFDGEAVVEGALEVFTGLADDEAAAVLDGVAVDGAAFEDDPPPHALSANPMSSAPAPTALRCFMLTIQSPKFSILNTAHRRPKWTCGFIIHDFPAVVNGPR